MNIRLGVGDLLLKIIYILYITHIFTDIMQKLNTCQNTSGICISFCASMRKNILGVLFLPATALWGKRMGGRVGISSCTYNGGNIFYHILSIEYRQRVSHYKNHYKTKRSHRLRWSKYACVLSNCLSRFFAYFC